MKKYGFARGDYQKRKDDGFELINVRVTNSVRCVPPQNKVTGDEVKNCGAYLIEEIRDMPNLKVVLTLGSVAHNALLGVLGYRKSAFNTGVLTFEMFEEIVKKLKELC